MERRGPSRTGGCVRIALVVLGRLLELAASDSRLISCAEKVPDPVLVPKAAGFEDLDGPESNDATPNREPEPRMKPAYERERRCSASSDVGDSTALSGDRLPLIHSRTRSRAHRGITLSPRAKTLAESAVDGRGNISDGHVQKQGMRLPNGAHPGSCWRHERRRRGVASWDLPAATRVGRTTGGDLRWKWLRLACRDC